MRPMTRVPLESHGAFLSESSSALRNLTRTPTTESRHFLAASPERESGMSNLLIGGALRTTALRFSGPLIDGYVNVCSMLTGMLANEICCLPIRDRARGIQYFPPPNNPYSTTTAEISSFIGDVNAFATIFASAGTGVLSRL